MRQYEYENETRTRSASVLMCLKTAAPILGWRSGGSEAARRGPGTHAMAATAVFQGSALMAHACFDKGFLLRSVSVAPALICALCRTWLALHA